MFSVVDVGVVEVRVREDVLVAGHLVRDGTDHNLSNCYFWTCGPRQSSFPAWWGHCRNSAHLSVHRIFFILIHRNWPGLVSSGIGHYCLECCRDVFLRCCWYTSGIGDEVAIMVVDFISKEGGGVNVPARVHQRCVHDCHWDCWSLNDINDSVDFFYFFAYDIDSFTFFLSVNSGGDDASERKSRDYAN